MNQENQNIEYKGGVLVTFQRNNVNLKMTDGTQIGTQITTESTGKSTPKSTLKSTLKGTRKSILEIIKSNPNITLDQVAAQLRKNPRGIDKHIKILREQGLLRRVDGNNGGHWEIIE